MSNTHLVTAKGGRDHIRPADIGMYQALTEGSGVMIRDGCHCELYDANTILVEAGELLVEGRYLRIPQEVRLPIQSGAPGGNRNDLVVLHYTLAAGGDGEMAASGIADMPLEVMPGTPVAGEPSDPPVMSGSIINGALESAVPFARVKVRGLLVEEPEELITRVSPFGVGAVVSSPQPFNPAQAYGGIWEELPIHGFVGAWFYKRVG